MNFNNVTRPVPLTQSFISL